MTPNERNWWSKQQPGDTHYNAGNAGHEIKVWSHCSSDEIEDKAREFFFDMFVGVALCAFGFGLLVGWMAF